MALSTKLDEYIDILTIIYKDILDTISNILL